MKKSTTQREANQLGGQQAQRVLYRCPVCQTMGYGSRFIAQHLTEGCKGPGKKTLRNQKHFIGREQEAMLNSACWNAKQMIKNERDAFLDMKSRIQADIDRMKAIGNEFTQEKKIF